MQYIYENIAEVEGKAVKMGPEVNNDP